MNKLTTFVYQGDTITQTQTHTETITNLLNTPRIQIFSIESILKRIH